MNTSIRYRTPDGEAAVMALYDAALNSWPVPYETQSIPTRHGDTFVIASGNPLSPAMILLHGAGSNSTMWAGDVSAYSQHFRVYAVDLVGEAGKSADNRPAWDTPAFAEWLEDVINGLGVHQAALVGLSQGAWTALKFATLMPERVNALVLIAPGGIVRDRPSFLLRAILMALLGNMGVKRLVRALFGDQQVPEDVIEIVVQMTREFKPRIGVLPIFTDDALRRLTMPTLLLGGTKDIIRDSDAIASRLRTLVPHLEVSIIAGGGHALLNTSGRIVAFLTRQEVRQVDAAEAI